MSDKTSDKYRITMNDTISRQAAIDAMVKLEQDDIDQYGCKIPEGFDSKPAIEALNGLPPVTPQPKAGHWIYTGDYITEGMLKCSECGFEHDVSERFSYCPNCGAKMREVEE